MIYQLIMAQLLPPGTYEGVPFDAMVGHPSAVATAHAASDYEALRCWALDNIECWVYAVNDAGRMRFVGRAK